MSNYMLIKWTNQKKWTDSQKSSTSQDNPKDIEIMNKPITNTEIEAVIKNLPKTKAEGQKA